MKGALLSVLSVLAVIAALAWAHYPGEAPDPCGGRFKVGEVVYYSNDITPARVVARDCRRMTYRIAFDGDATLDGVGEEDLGREP